MALRWQTTPATARAVSGRCILSVEKADWWSSRPNRYDWFVMPTPVPGEKYHGGFIARGKTLTKTEARRAAAAVAASERCRR